MSEELYTIYITLSKYCSFCSVKMPSVEGKIKGYANVAAPPYVGYLLARDSLVPLPAAKR